MRFFQGKEKANPNYNTGRKVLNGSEKVEAPKDIS